MNLYNSVLLSLLLFSCDFNPYGHTCTSTRNITYLAPDAELLRYYNLLDEWSCAGVQRAEDSAIENIEKYVSGMNVKLLSGYTVRYVNSYGWKLPNGNIAIGQADWVGKTIMIRLGTTCAEILTHEFLHVVSNYDSWWFCGEPHCDWASRNFYAAVWAPMKCLEPLGNSHE